MYKIYLMLYVVAMVATSLASWQPYDMDVTCIFGGREYVHGDVFMARPCRRCCCVFGKKVCRPVC